MTQTHDLYIGNTDHEWFEFCKSQTNLEEVNFWQPSAKKFRVLEEGGIFFFRRKAPINMIGGFGVLAASENASIGLLWDDLGIANGVESEKKFIDRVKKYKKTEFVDRSTQVGFKIIVEPLFLNEEEWFELPKDWSPNIVTGKGYTSSSDAGQYLLSKYRQYARKHSKEPGIPDRFFGFSDGPQEGYLTDVKGKVRIGQQAFRAALIYAYEGRCAATGSSIKETLEAAHIFRFSESEDHSLENGLLLRADIHALFDAGFINIDKNYVLHISKRLRSLYPESSEYDFLDGRRLTLPKQKRHRPSVELLEYRQKYLLEDIQS